MGKRRKDRGGGEGGGKGGRCQELKGGGGVGKEAREEGQSSFLGPRCSRGIPTVGQAVFCFGNVTKT